MSDAPALALSVDISDRVTVMERDAGIDYFLETIRFRLQRGLAHLVQYTLSPALPYGDTAVFGTAVFRYPSGLDTDRVRRDMPDMILTLRTGQRILDKNFPRIELSRLLVQDSVGERD